MNLTLSPLASVCTGTLPVAVSNMSFLLTRLGEDCAPLQFLREFTQNSIDALMRSPRRAGTVTWDMDWSHLDYTGVMKLSCIDNGVGMSGPDMVRYINSLSSSCHEQSATGNFGVGAKISAITRNPQGLVYISWQGGRGAMVHMWFDKTAQCFGLKRWPENKGEFWVPVSDALKPTEIDQDGTVVIFHGQSRDHNTMAAPEHVTMPSRWILRNLNTRYFRFPVGIDVRAREGWNVDRLERRRNFLRNIEGQEAWLERSAQSKGSVALSGATAHWWIIREDRDRNSGHFAPCGQIAVLFQNELYDMRSGAQSKQPLQSFGATFGHDRVVIYIEPDTGTGHLISANTARTQLRVGERDLDWTQWASEFRDRLPDELVLLQQQINAKAKPLDNNKSIMQRLASAAHLYLQRAFLPNPSGKFIVPMNVVRTKLVDDLRKRITKSEPPEFTEERDTEDQPTNEQQRKRIAPNLRNDSDNEVRKYYKKFLDIEPTRVDELTSLEDIKATWLSVADGTRSAADLEDRAAQYVEHEKRLLINADFRVFTGMTDRWTEQYGDVPGAEHVIRDTVREWFEQQLIETVMSASAFRDSGSWSKQEIAELWSETALTAAVLPRWHIDSMVGRSLAQRLGASRASNG